ncbi:MAG TPA: metallophosphoesterase family protein [Acidimicrobiales bacterium]|nr:metallophosphoesterase family protein [Acidimicrobiales bacterium]
MTLQRVVVLADTHLRAGRPRQLPDAIWAAIADCQLVLHAGDVVDASLLGALHDRHVPYRAVLGNNDLTLRDTLPERLEFDIEGVPVAMVHDSGAAKGRPARLRRWFPDAQVVVFGHSHAPCNEWHDGQLLFNPGSAAERRQQPARTFGVIEIDTGRVIKNEIRPTE